MPNFVLYLDTSVVSAYSDDRDPPRMLATREFWSKLSSYEAWISDLVVREIRQTSNPARKSAMEKLLRPLRTVQIDDEMLYLAARYVQPGVFGATSANDALHVAAGTITRVDAIVSWNFQHLVRVRTIQGVSAVNLHLGYRTVDIRSPLEL